VTRIPVPAEAASALDRWLGGGNWNAEAIAGDASARQYFRVQPSSGPSEVLAYYPPEAREGLARFLRAYSALKGHVRVPEVREHDDSCVLQEDVGDRCLSTFLSGRNPEATDLYRRAAALIEDLARIGPEGRAINPAFDRAKFLEELDISCRYYVEELAGADSAPLVEQFERLANRLVSHRYVLCHRDYHGQNIYIINNTLYLIDYQDMRLGPDTYDMASLLRDRGVWRTLGRDLENELLVRHAETIGEDVKSVRDRYFEALLQRSIKAIGTFARLSVVYGRRQYLSYIDPTLETVRECATGMEEWSELLSAFPFEYHAP